MVPQLHGGCAHEHRHTVDACVNSWIGGPQRLLGTSGVMFRVCRLVKKMGEASEFLTKFTTRKEQAKEQFDKKVVSNDVSPNYRCHMWRRSGKECTVCCHVDDSARTNWVGGWNGLTASSRQIA